VYAEYSDTVVRGGDVRMLTCRMSFSPILIELLLLSAFSLFFTSLALFISSCLIFLATFFCKGVGGAAS